jgi:hypothetical protein
MNGKGMFVATMLIVAMFATVVMPAEAKYWTTKYGHKVIVYEAKDIPTNLKPYITGLEYDMAYYLGYDYGARLYFTSKGKSTMASLTGVGTLQSVTKFVMGNIEWYPSRGYLSVSSEIQQHAIWPYRMQVDIQYFCSDLEWWEQPYKSYC